MRSRVQFPLGPISGLEAGNRFSVSRRKPRSIVGFEKQWSEFLTQLAASDLKMLRKITGEVLKEKFPSIKKRSSPKSRNVYRVFSDLDLMKLFSAIPAKRAKQGLAMFLMLTGGFRVGEVVKIRLQDCDFERGVISLLTEKAELPSDQPMPQIALECIQMYAERYKEEIKQANGFLFFSLNPFQKRERISVDHLRNFFGKCRQKAGLTNIYAEAFTPSHENPCKKKLFKLSTHSFRRTYLTRLYQFCKQKELVKVLARHKKEDTTDQYIFFSHQEQLELVNKVFNSESYESIAKELIEKM
ncbi:MAG: site-specific integrase [Candidatus Diapherotrites archaeon]